jgi:hypothetical protein
MVDPSLFSAGYPCHKVTSLPAALLTYGLAARSRACRVGNFSSTIIHVMGVEVANRMC